MAEKPVFEKITNISKKKTLKEQLKSDRINL